MYYCNCLWSIKGWAPLSHAIQTHHIVSNDASVCSPDGRVGREHHLVGHDPILWCTTSSRCHGVHSALESEVKLDPLVHAGHWTQQTSYIIDCSVTMNGPNQWCSAMKNINTCSIFVTLSATKLQVACPSVCLFLHRLIAHGFGQFLLKFWAYIRRDSRGQCKLNTRGYEKLAFSTYSSIYFKNDTRYGHSYNGSIEWCHLQWPSMTPNQDFKVTIFWTSNNSKMVQDRAIVTTADQ